VAICLCPAPLPPLGRGQPVFFPFFQLQKYNKFLIYNKYPTNIEEWDTNIEKHKIKIVPEKRKIFILEFLSIFISRI